MDVISDIKNTNEILLDQSVELLVYLILNLVKKVKLAHKIIYIYIYRIRSLYWLNEDEVRPTWLGTKRVSFKIDPLKSNNLLVGIVGNVAEKWRCGQKM